MALCLLCAKLYPLLCGIIASQSAFYEPTVILFYRHHVRHQYGWGGCFIDSNRAHGGANRAID